MRFRPTRLQRPTGIIACNREEALPPRWFVVGFVAAGYDERTRVSRLGRRERWDPLGGRGKKKGWPYGFSPEGCGEMEEGLVWFLDESSRERLDRRREEERTGGGLAEKGSETLNVEKRKTKQRNIPQRMLQTSIG